MVSPEFFITALIVILIPGTGVIYTISSGLFAGWRASIAAALGCTAGIIPHLIACVLGLSALLHLSALAFQALKFAGAAYLLYIAWSMWKETGSFCFDAPEQKNNLGQIAWRGFFINILNPKLSVFFLAFLPQFIPAGSSSPVFQLLLLSILFMGMTFGVFILYGITAHRVSSFMLKSPKYTVWLRKTFAVFFASLGFRLAAAEQ